MEEIEKEEEEKDTKEEFVERMVASGMLRKDAEDQWNSMMIHLDDEG